MKCVDVSARSRGPEYTRYGSVYRLARGIVEETRNLEGALLGNSATLDLLGEFLKLKSRYLRRQLRPALMVTWGLPEDFGGLTAMCLKRSSIFHENGIPSAVVTFKPDPGYRAQVNRALSEGRTSTDVPIINLHEFYTTYEPLPFEEFSPPTPTDFTNWRQVDRMLRGHDGTLFWVDFADADTGALSRREYYRPDGSLYLLDCQLPAAKSSGKPRRVLQLFSASGGFVVEFWGAAKFYRYWLSELIGDHEADVIVDSELAASFLWSWEHPGVAKTTVLHTTHVQAGEDAQTGQLAKEVRATVDHRSHWDRLVVLTSSQATAFQRRFSNSANIAVIGNPVDGPTAPSPWKKRERSKILIIGRLKEDKRVEKAFDVVEILRKSGIDVELDIVGNGDHRSELETQVLERDLEDCVHFIGHVSDVPDRLERAGVALLCSKFEGQSLALLEAKAHGCVPVAFDVDFGPREVITQGVSGFLVPDGDSASMADRVRQLVTDETLHRQMSGAAFAEAQSHRSGKVYRQWQEELEQARSHSLIRHQLESSVISLAGFALDENGRLELTVRCTDLPPESKVRLILQGRKEPAEAKRVTVEAETRRGADSTFVLSVKARTMHSTGDPVDLYVELECDGASHTSRLGVPDIKTTLSPFLTGYGNLSIR